MTILEIKSKGQLCSLLGISEKKLNFLLYKLPPTRKYRDITIAKRNGQPRHIRAPIKPLKDLQRKVADLLQMQYRPKQAVHGYALGRGIVSNASAHTAKRWVVSADIKDFFPSINFGRVRGLFLAEPFNYSKEAATVLAQILTIDNELPQGSPASPVISNLICKQLDNALSTLAKESRCHYTRYADDICFSSKTSIIPTSLSVKSPDGTQSIGASLSKILGECGFYANPSKYRVREKCSRMLVTGVVVNRKKNVPREFIKKIRTSLHVLEKHGENEALAHYLRVSERNKPEEREPSDIKMVIRGRIQHVGHVKGWGDSTYISLAKRLYKIDKRFKPTAANILRAHVRTEGDTDTIHIRNALSRLQKRNEFRNINLSLSSANGDTKIKTEIMRNQPYLTSEPLIYLVDSDNQALLSDLGITESNWKKHHSFYVLKLPKPDYRENLESICIEHLFPDSHIQNIRDGEGRRLYFKHEFDSRSQKHKEDYTLASPSARAGNLVIDQVFGRDISKNIALSKMDFARLSEVNDSSDYSGFSSLFESILEILHS